MFIAEESLGWTGMGMGSEECLGAQPRFTVALVEVLKVPLRNGNALCTGTHLLKGISTVPVRGWVAEQLFLKMAR